VRSCPHADRAPCLRQADPANAPALAAYAVFVHDERGDAEQASALFEEAAELAPNDLDVLASWAYFAMIGGH
jgi:tetratricopeptide (TPR) repeat protein